MKKLSKNTLLLFLFLVFDGVVTSLRLQNLGVETPWVYILQSWILLTCVLGVTYIGLHKWTNVAATHWSIVALSVAAGCAAGNAYLPIPFGAWIGVIVCVGCVVLTRSVPYWVTVVCLTLLWFFATPKGQSLPDTMIVETHPDIVVITIDTVREDAISQSTNRLIPNLTPNLDLLAQSGCWTNDASATSPLA